MKNKFSEQEEKYIKRALLLAARGKGKTSPNPMVGAVIVKNGKILGEGYHKRFGDKHAEINALDSLKISLKGATLYLNLEPCCHFGKTPPCTDLITSSGIKRVVVSALDPNPLVKGKGVRQLRNAGIKVDVGLLRDDAIKLNEAFYTFHKKKRPFVIAKWAMTLDGRIATSTGDSKWISNSRSRKYVHRIREGVDAILIGANTAIKDDPQLNVRAGKKIVRMPVKIVLDPTLQISLTARLLKKGKVTIFAKNNAPIGKIKTLEENGASVIKLTAKDGKFSIKKVLEKLATLDIQSVLVEGGGAVLGSFFKEKLVDKAVVFISPKIIGGKNVLSPLRDWQGVNSVKNAVRLKNVKIRRFDFDICVEGYVEF